jgi:hypothetical protein
MSHGAQIPPSLSTLPTDNNFDQLELYTQTDGTSSTGIEYWQNCYQSYSGSDVGVQGSLEPPSWQDVYNRPSLESYGIEGGSELETVDAMFTSLVDPVSFDGMSAMGELPRYLDQSQNLATDGFASFQDPQSPVPFSWYNPAYFPALTSAGTHCF